MPPKRGTAKKEEEEQRKAEEEAMRAAEELHEMMAGGAAGGKVVPTMAMFMLMQKQMQEQMQQQEARHQAQMTVQQDQLTLLADRLAGAGVGPAGGVGGHGGGRASATCTRKIEAPRLKSPEDTMLAQFRDWRERFVEYAAITKMDTECDRRARRGVLREALHEDWSRLWSTGILEVNDTHDWTDIVECMSVYLRDQRSPLLDRLTFHEQSQHASELVDKYYANLQISYDSCGFDLDTRVLNKRTRQ